MAYSRDEDAQKNWKMAGPSMGMASGSSAVMSQITPAADGLVDKQAPMFKTDWLRTLPTGNAPNNVTAASLFGTFTEIALPRSAGKCTDFLVRLQSTLTLPNTDEVVIPPTPYWFDRVEVIYNGAVVEQLNNDTLFAEAATFQSDMEFNQVAPLIGMTKQTTSAGKEVATFSSYTGNGSTPVPLGLNGSLYLPIVGVLGSIQPFLNGFNGEWRLRFYWSNTITPTVYFDAGDAPAAALANDFHTTVTSPAGSATAVGTGHRPVVTINNIELWVKQASLDMEKTRALRELHTNSTVVYRGMRRTYQTTSIPLAVSDNKDTDLVLTSLSSHAAAIYAYLTPSSVATEDVLTRFPLTKLYLKDSGSVALSPPLPAELLENYISANATPIPSYFLNSSTFTNYVIPFASNLQTAMYGKQTGGYYFTGQEKLTYDGPSVNGTSAAAAPGRYSGPQAAITGLDLVVVSYDYCEIKVTKGDMAMSTRN
jgi:hypothetical protein